MEDTYTLSCFLASLGLSYSRHMIFFRLHDWTLPFATDSISKINLPLGVCTAVDRVGTTEGGLHVILQELEMPVELKIWQTGKERRFRELKEVFIHVEPLCFEASSKQSCLTSILGS